MNAQLHNWSPFAGKTGDSVRPFRCLDILVYTIPLNRNLNSRPLRSFLNTPKERWVIVDDHKGVSGF
jgi:hypothetical protein